MDSGWASGSSYDLRGRCIFDCILWLTPVKNPGVRVLSDDLCAKVTWQNGVAEEYFFDNTRRKVGSSCAGGSKS